MAVSNGRGGGAFAGGGVGKTRVQHLLNEIEDLKLGRAEERSIGKGEQ
jgi:hypothetical protein